MYCLTSLTGKKCRDTSSIAPRQANLGRSTMVTVEMGQTLRATPISDSTSGGSSCLMVCTPRKSPAGVFAVRRMPVEVTASSYPSSPSAGRAGAMLKRMVEAAVSAGPDTTGIAKPVDGRSTAASDSPMALVSVLSSTATTVVLVTSKGVPVPLTREAGAGTTPGATMTGAGVVTGRGGVATVLGGV